jgi:hypothetical protein
MCSAFFEKPAGRLGGLAVVDLPERINQQNVQNVTRSSRRGRARARMELLRNLVGKTQTAHGRNHGNPQFQQAMETGRQGGILLQYLPIDYNKWALEKAPGYVFYLIPFQKMGFPRYGNVLLALGMVIVTFLLLKRMRDEKAAMIGSLLMLFT